MVFKKKKLGINKSSAIKKEEIVQQYKQQLKELIHQYGNNSDKLKYEKINFIKNVNAELNKNIFFNSDEIKKIIYELTIL
jgi:UDP-N-acetylglucosamine transferase subunit ALG13